MENSSNLISIFHTASTVCLVLAVIFLLISILLFIKFNIRDIWAMKSGRAQSKAIREKQQEAAMSGKLRMKKRSVPEMKAAPQPVSEEPMAETEVLNQNQALEDNVELTSVLIQSAEAQAEEGTSLTAVLSNEEKMTAETGKFLVIKQIRFIHTEEKI